MLKQITQFKSVINEIENVFQFDANCPLNIAKESLLECLKWIGKVEDEAKAQAEAKKAEEEAKKTEEPEQALQESKNEQPAV